MAAEYRFQYDGLDAVIKRFTGWPKEFPIAKLRELAEQLSLEILCDEQRRLPYKWAAGFENNPWQLACLLFETGVLLVKANRTAPPKPFQPDNPINPTDDTWLAIHPTYQPGLELVGA